MDAVEVDRVDVVDVGDVVDEETNPAELDRGLSMDLRVLVGPTEVHCQLLELVSAEAITRAAQTFESYQLDGLWSP